MLSGRVCGGRRRRRAAGEVQYREQQLQMPFKSKADEDRAHLKEQHV